MKKANISSIVKNTVFTVLVAILSFAPVFKANAQDKGKEDTVEIKYLGSVGDQPIFSVDFENATEEEVLVTMKDNEGNVLYYEKFKEKKFSKKFQLQRHEDELKVTLTISSKKDRQVQQFQINRNTRIVEDVVVTKVR